MWHCPHCGAPQAEAARCWVCHKSSTTCSTCRHFQTSLTSDFGWCGLDPKRRPLTGREQRGCWQERPATTASPPSRRPPADQTEAPATPPLDFVPVELIGRVVITTEPTAPETIGLEVVAQDILQATEPDQGWTGRTSLFGEPEA